MIPERYINDIIDDALISLIFDVENIVKDPQERAELIKLILQKEKKAVKEVADWNTEF